MSKHLSYDDRLEIQAGLKERLDFTQIAKRIGKSRTTVSREVLSHRKRILPKNGNRCKYRSTCNQPLICRDRCKEKCRAAAKQVAMCATVFAPILLKKPVQGMKSRLMYATAVTSEPVAN